MSADHESIRWVYDHLRATLERDDRGREMYVSKSKQMMAVAVGSAAALSFAVTKIEWAMGSFWIFILAPTACATGYCIARAFVAGCLCIQIADAAVVRVDTLSKALNSHDIERRNAMDIYVDLSANVATAILDNRRILNSRKNRACVLNKFTLWGIGLTIVTVFFAVVGDTVSSHLAAQAVSEQSANVGIEQPKQ